jgi:hypothetical protein
MWVYGAAVLNAGSNDTNSTVAILLKTCDGLPFNERWFVAAKNSRKEMLATALAAMAAAKSVNADFSKLDEWSPIDQLLMTRFPV